MRTMLQVIYCRNLIKLVLLIDYRLWQHCGISRWIFLSRYVCYVNIREEVEVGNRILLNQTKR